MARYLTEFIGTFFLVLTIGLTVLSGSVLAPLAIGLTTLIPIGSRPLPVAWSITGVFGVPVLAREARSARDWSRNAVPRADQSTAADMQRLAEDGVDLASKISCHAIKNEPYLATRISCHNLKN